MRYVYHGERELEPHLFVIGWRSSCGPNVVSRPHLHVHCRIRHVGRKPLQRGVGRDQRKRTIADGAAMLAGTCLGGIDRQTQNHYQEGRKTT